MIEEQYPDEWWIDQDPYPGPRELHPDATVLEEVFGYYKQTILQMGRQYAVISDSLAKALHGLLEASQSDFVLWPPASDPIAKPDYVPTVRYQDKPDWFDKQLNHGPYRGQVYNRRGVKVY